MASEWSRNQELTNLNSPPPILNKWNFNHDIRNFVRWRRAWVCWSRFRRCRPSRKSQMGAQWNPYWSYEYICNCSDGTSCCKNASEKYLSSFCPPQKGKHCPRSSSCSTGGADRWWRTRSWGRTYSGTGCARWRCWKIRSVSTLKKYWNLRQDLFLVWWNTWCCYRRLGNIHHIPFLVS